VTPRTSGADPGPRVPPWLHRIASRLFLLPQLPLRPSSLASHLVVAQACCASFDTDRPHCHEARSPMFVMRSIDMLGTSVSDASPDCSMSRTTSVYGRPMMMLGSIFDPRRNLGGSASRKLPHTMLSTTSTASEGDSFALPRPAAVSMFRKGARRSRRLLGYRIRIELGMHMCRGRHIDGRRR
jgi:hypothetical protein